LHAFATGGQGAPVIAEVKLGFSSEPDVQQTFTGKRQREYTGFDPGRES
jgi:hypothetical protein